jgi:hypothetical protein
MAQKITTLNQFNPFYENPRIESFSRLRGDLAIRTTNTFWGSSSRFFQIFLKGKILAIFPVNPDERTVPEEIIVVSTIKKVSEVRLDDDLIFQIILENQTMLLNSTSHPTNEDWIIALEYLRNYYANDAEFHHMVPKKRIDREIINRISVELELENWKRVSKELDFSLFIKAKNMKCFNELQPGVKNRVLIGPAILQKRDLKMVQTKQMSVR